MDKINIVISYDHRGEIAATEVGLWLENNTSYSIHLDIIKHPENFAATALLIADQVNQKPNYYGVLICKTGVGMCYAANKVKGARAAVIHNIVDMIYARMHHNVRIFCFGTGFMKPGDMAEIAQIGVNIPWLAGKYEEREAAIKGM